MIVGRSVCLREKASSWRTSAAARLAFWRICIRSPCSTSATSWRISSRSQWPLIAVSRLLKSCATPPASWPTACIFWDWTNCASSVFSSVASESTASSEGAPSRMVRVKATCRKISGAVDDAARDLGAAERAAAGGVGEPLGDRPAEALDQLGDVDAGLGARSPSSWRAALLA